MTERGPGVGDNIGGGRALQVCDLCGGVDDHPRHQFVGGVAGQAIIRPPSEAMVAKVMANSPEQHRAEMVARLTNVTTTDRHLDCCRADGCPTGECDARTAGAEHLRGGALLEHLVALPVHAEAVAAVKATATRLDRPAELEG